MNVRNIVRTAAEYLCLKNLVKFIDGEVESTEEIERDIANMLIAVNIVNNTIASSYIELTDEVKIYMGNDIVDYKSITDKSIIEIKTIEGCNGNKISFKLLPSGVKVESSGQYKIEYTYFPEKVKLDDEINYYLKLNELTFAMGVAGEYLYIKGVIDDAYMWDKRFKSSLFNLLRPRRNIVMPSRRW